MKWCESHSNFDCECKYGLHVDITNCVQCTKDIKPKDLEIYDGDGFHKNCLLKYAWSLKH